MTSRDQKHEERVKFHNRLLERNVVSNSWHRLKFVQKRGRIVEIDDMIHFEINDRTESKQKNNGESGAEYNQYENGEQSAKPAAFQFCCNRVKKDCEKER